MFIYYMGCAQLYMYFVCQKVIYILRNNEVKWTVR